MYGTRHLAEETQWHRAELGPQPVRAEGESELLLRKSDAATDRMELIVYADATGKQLRLIARLDNLGKGASGACVQNLNIMAGLPETAGLQL